MVTVSENRDDESIGTADLAAEVGVSRQLVARWSREGLEEAAKLGHGKWHRQRALAWIEDRREDSQLPADLNALRARLYGLQGDAQEIRNDILRSNVITVDSARGIYAKAIADQVQVGDVWVTQAVNAAEQELRRELWFELRNRIAESVEGVCAAIERGEDVAVTRLRYSQRMG